VLDFFQGFYFFDSLWGDHAELPYSRMGRISDLYRVGPEAEFKCLIVLFDFYGVKCFASFA
jgi:hypothetical protein